ncbi:MAG: exodeoxyribonuclease VII small subunit [Syntrophomonadaceae bacterium]|jgi:exodeoxyribonuclease VII small subunit|nr:exodeoxyribonuclease VII small subunit [Syntrophomonadaceae bacterium]
MKKNKFEDALKALEAIVDKLESGALDLEESIKLYEEGIDLSVYCQKQLAQAEGKIQRLMRKLDGDLQTLDLEDL